MVAKNDIPRVNALFGRFQQYADAMIVFDHDPHVSAFTLTATQPAPEEEAPNLTLSEVTVAAEGIVTPPQMIAAIKDQIEARMQAINDELTELGVSPAAVPQKAPEARTAPPPPKPPSPPPAAPKPASTSHNRTGAHHAPHKGRR